MLGSRIISGAFAMMHDNANLEKVYALHKTHLPNGGLTVYRYISGEQFHGNNAS